MTKKFQKLLQDVGLRHTRQRDKIATILFSGPPQHFSAEQLYEIVKNKPLKISLATIYNTLRDFTSAGLLKEITIESDRTWYDTCVENHHHFYNPNNNELLDIPSDCINVSNLPKPPQGHKIESVNVIIRLNKK